jgi:hypothetical protein
VFAGYLAKNGMHRFPLSADGLLPLPYVELFQRALCGAITVGRSTRSEWLWHLSGTSRKAAVAALSANKGWHYAKGQHPIARRLERVFADKAVPAESSQGILVKSVHATLALPALLQAVPCTPVVVVRHPASIVSSYLQLNMPDADRHLDAVPALREGPLAPYTEALDALQDPLARMGAQVAIAYHLLSIQVEQKPIPIHQHEVLCEDPVARIHALYDSLGLSWNDNFAAKIAERNRGGQGFDTLRVASEQIDVWKRRLKPDQIAAIASGYRILPNPFYPPF